MESAISAHWSMDRLTGYLSTFAFCQSEPITDTNSYFNVISLGKTKMFLYICSAWLYQGTEKGLLEHFDGIFQNSEFPVRVTSQWVAWKQEPSDVICTPTFTRPQTSGCHPRATAVGTWVPGRPWCGHRAMGAMGRGMGLSHFAWLRLFKYVLT